MLKLHARATLEPKEILYFLLKHSPDGGSAVPEALLEPGVGAGLTGSPW